MILNQEQTNFLLNSKTHYECELIQHRFSFDVFGNSLSPFGNLICFEAPTKIGPVAFEESLVIAAELFNTNIFGGVCFQRLYTAGLGSFLTSITNNECMVNEGCIIINNKQTSISLISKRKESILFNVIFPLKYNITDSFGPLELSEENKQLFKENIVNSFHALVRSVFLEAQRDNF